MMRVQSPRGVAAAIVALTLPLGANAATVNADLAANETFSEGFTMEPGDTQRYSFSVTEDLVISRFAVSGTGPAGDRDLSNVRFGLDNPPQDSFDDIETQSDASAATDFIEGSMFESGEEFSFFFSDGVESDVGLTLAFDTESPSPVPVPGTGLLLFSALAGGAAWSRRRKKQA